MEMLMSQMKRVAEKLLKLDETSPQQKAAAERAKVREAARIRREAELAEKKKRAYYGVLDYKGGPTFGGLIGNWEYDVSDEKGGWVATGMTDLRYCLEQMRTLGIEPKFVHLTPAAMAKVKEMRVEVSLILAGELPL